MKEEERRPASLVVFSEGGGGGILGEALGRCCFSAFFRFPFQGEQYYDSVSRFCRVLPLGFYLSGFRVMY